MSRDDSPADRGKHGMYAWSATRLVAAAALFLIRERREIREFRASRINHAVAEAAYSVPVRPCRPKTVMD